MDGLKKMIGSEISRLNEIKNKLELKDENLLEGRLKVSSANGKRIYVHVGGDFHDGKEKYISKENIDLARRLAQKSYEKKVNRKVDRVLIELKRLDRVYCDDFVESIYNELLLARREIVIPVEATGDQLMNEWKSSPYVGKGFIPGATEIYTKKGERVRSKSEKILADKFYDLGIEYKYECPLSLENNIVLYPDFTFFNPSQRKEIYWEHFGLMDNVTYLNNTIKKIKLYEMNGYFQGRELITSFESSNCSLDFQWVDVLIDKYLS